MIHAAICYMISSFQVLYAESEESVHAMHASSWLEQPQQSDDVITSRRYTAMQIDSIL